MNVDLSEYDGLVFDVASQDLRSLSFNFVDNHSNRWLIDWILDGNSWWTAIFDVPGGM